MCGATQICYDYYTGGMIMTIQDHILSWANTLPEWQNDLIRRLYQNGAVEGEQIETVLANLLYAQGDTTYSPNILLLEKDHIPNKSSSNNTRLLAITDLENIGSVQGNNSIQFEPNTLTIIYGDNSAGKSTYAKILKQACRAVDDKVKIHPNVFKAKAEIKAGKAKLHIEHSGKQMTIERTANTSPDPLLSSISIFDTECAQIYSENENTVVFIPSELRIFDTLAHYQTRIHGLLKNKKEELNKSKPIFPELKPQSKIKMFLDSITYQTEQKEVDSSCIFSEKEQEALDQIEEDLKIILANDPGQFIKEINRNVADALKLAKSLQKISDAIKMDNIQKLIDLQRDYLQSKETLRTISEEAFKEEPVSGVGSNVWKNLWNAARMFHKEAYPTNEFPHVSSEYAKCLLCHQVLEQEAKERLIRFETFISDTINIEAKRIEKERDAMLDCLKQLPFQEIRESSVRSYIAAEKIQVDIEIENFINTSFEIVNKILQYFEQANDIPDFDLEPLLSPVPILMQWIEGKKSEASRKSELVNDKYRIQIEKQKFELTEQKKVYQRIDEVRKLIGLLQEEQRLDKAIRAIDTGRITRKYNELTNTYVSDHFKERVSKELKALNAEHILFRINSRGTKGKTTVKLDLNSEHRVRVNEILSEGEQKLLALAFFLAEISALSPDGGIILDDPVSSLDHSRRNYVAKRLVEEAQNRQVILFTHDIVFMNSLQYHMNLSKGNHKTCIIRRTGSIAGISSDSLPWVAQKTSDRVKYLRNQIQELSKLVKENQEDAYQFQAKNWYMLLRESWERAVEELLFNNVIQRFNPGVQTLRLGKLDITQDKLDDIERGMTKSSNWVHDQTVLMNTIPPQIEELEQDLKALDDFQKKCR